MTLTQRRMAMEAIMNRRVQVDAVASAVLTIEMMGLTLETGMVQCPPPHGFHPLRWKAMIAHTLINGLPEK